MGWITPIAFLLCHTYSIGDAATLETFSSKSVLSPERGALTGHFRKYLGDRLPVEADLIEPRVSPAERRREGSRTDFALNKRGPPTPTANLAPSATANSRSKE